MILFRQNLSDFRDALIAFELRKIVYMARYSSNLASSGMPGGTVFSRPSSYVLCSVAQNDAGISSLLRHLFLMPVRGKAVTRKAIALRVICGMELMDQRHRTHSDRESRG